MHRYVRTHSDIDAVDKVMVLERIEFIMFHALEQPVDGLITLDNHLQVQRMVNPCFGDSFGALPTRTSARAHTHTHTTIFWFRKTAIIDIERLAHNLCFLRLCLVCMTRTRIYVWMWETVANDLERHFFSPEEVTQYSRHTLLQLSSLLITVVF